MKFSEIFRYEISNKCIYDEDKFFDIQCDKCKLKNICEQICDIEESRNK